jgi:hypothetical protein
LKEGQREQTFTLTPENRKQAVASMIDELRQRLITGLPVTDPWAIDALHDHELEKFTDFTDEKL